MKVRRPVTRRHTCARSRRQRGEESASVSLIQVQLLHLWGLFSRGGPLNMPTGLPVFFKVTAGAVDIYVS